MGKMVLLVVLGSYFLIGNFLRNNGDTSTDTVTNVVNYYAQTNSKHIASSAANLAVANVYKDKKWKSGFKDLEFSNGKMNVSVSDEPSLGPGGVRILAIGQYFGYKDSVIVDLNVAYFSKYMMFSDKMPSNGYYVTGDTMDGPFHTNGKLNISGKPIFKGRVTMGQGPMKLSSWYAKPEPEFVGGYEYGVNISMPKDLGTIESAAKSNGFYFDGDLWITFNNDNTVSYRTSAGGPDSTFDIKTLAPNGVLAVKGDVRLKGNISGAVTVAALKDGSKGNVYLEDDVGVVDDPRKNPKSQEMLGICAEQGIIVSDNTPNKSSINITAAMFTLKSFVVENVYSRGPSGYINLYGSLTQDTDGITGVGAAGKLISGFHLNYKYDERYFLDAPPEFPLTDRFQILSWWE
jgi:hypothetical protein